MDVPVAAPVTNEEIAEVIDLIDELRKSPDTLTQSLALCRSVSELTMTPKLALHGVVCMLAEKRESDQSYIAKALDQVSAAHPNTRWLQFQCGYHYGEISKLPEAIQCYETVLGIKPSAKAHFQLAMLHKRGMDFKPCIEHLEKCLSLNAKYPGAAGELLYIMSMKGDLERFESLMDDPSIADPRRAKSFNRLGQTLVHHGNRRAAVQWFDKAIELEPHNFNYQWSKHLTVSTNYRTEDDLAKSRAQYLMGLNRLNEIFDSLDEKAQKLTHQVTQMLTNFEIHYQSENDTEVQQPYGALIHKIMSASYPDYMQPLPRRHPGNSRRIRIGFASWGCFFTHSNYKTHSNWLLNLNKEKFEVFGYALAPYKDQATTLMSKNIEHFLPHGEHVSKLRDQIRADELDILVYPAIGMEPIVHRLAPLRLAPVQCTSWGHPVTSGFPNIDYYLSSDLMEPDNAQTNYTETLIRLPNLGISQIPPGLPNQYRAPELLANRPRPATVFLCSQNVLKMMPKHDFLFARILQSVPDSEIWFIQSKREDISRMFRKRLSKVCQSYGVDFESRCLMLPRLGKAEFCYVNEHADIMLDTCFWSGCNTTFETLVHQTPVITLPGNTMRGRHTAAILRLHGMGELVCASEQEYVSLAQKLATDTDFYRQIQNKITAIQPQLFGDDTVIEALENFFERSLTGDV
ncbi:MAG: hypothetical protein KTR18_01715 [Acidiferrobacterales bacterium]|nr:hypothetical protein [Acidiferrobacterales bacterium]